MERLPIDEVLPAVVDAVRTRGTLVLVAAPGAGKTTRVPGALLDAGVIRGEIVVLQPRRIAARLAAARIASERGVELGAEVGYEVRFDRKRGRDTRISLVTEGILTRRLLSDPELRGVGCVIIDEFHERHLDGDLALALLARLRAEQRPDLALVVMSATLDAEPVANFLSAPAAPIVRSEGRAFPIAIEYAEPRAELPLGRQVSGAVRRLAQDGLDGDVLVFLPGAGEIARCADDLAEVAQLFGLDVLPLHGELSAEDQDRAAGRRRGTRPRVILATNVAETSVTIDGVAFVIDSGLARIARHSPWTGLPSLLVEPVSRASCAQRAGRAGRTRPGRVIRLFSQHDHDQRRAFEVPEIQRADLTQVALELHGAGVAPRSLRWFEAPAPAALDAAEALLRRLGAVDGEAIAPRGERMLRFPVHPRLARIVVEGEERGVAREACAAAALLGTRTLRMERRGRGAEARVASDSDVIDEIDTLFDVRRRGYRGEGIDPGAARLADRVAGQLERALGATRSRGLSGSEVDRELQLCILTGFPDRVAQRRAPRSAELVFSGGGSGVLAPSSAVVDAQLMVAVDAAEVGARGQGTKVQIRRASAIEASWLLDLYLDWIEERDDVVWNGERQRVERVRQLVYDGLIIDEHRDVEGARSHPGTAALLAQRALAAGIGTFVDAEAFGRWRARVAFAAGLAPAVTPPTDDGLQTLIAAACDGATSFAELRAANLLDLLDAGLGSAKALVDKLAPRHLALPRRRVEVHYEPDKPPWIASRLQDFFGMTVAPTVGEGRVQLVVHLLAPNQRAVQITQDLPSFWARHYPALRNQLMRRYPKHAWPEDPTRVG